MPHIHPEAHLLFLALGLLPQEQTHHVQTHVQGCARCVNSLAQVKDELAQLALALPPVVAPPLLREGLLHAIGEVSRFSCHIDSVMLMLNVDRMQAERLLFTLDDAATWEPSSLVGARIRPLGGRGSPCFLRLGPGHAVLSPRLQGSDQAYVLQGRCRDACGREYRPGARLRLEVRGEPHFAVLAGIEFICLLKDDTHVAGQQHELCHQHVVQKKAV